MSYRYGSREKEELYDTIKDAILCECIDVRAVLQIVGDAVGDVWTESIANERTEIEKRYAGYCGHGLCSADVNGIKTCQDDCKELKEYNNYHKPPITTTGEVLLNKDQAKRFIEAIEASEKWSKDHPRKTRKSEFLKLFPSANPEVIHPCTIEKDYLLKNNCVRDCEDCNKRYWSEEIEND